MIRETTAARGVDVWAVEEQGYSVAAGRKPSTGLKRMIGISLVVTCA